MNGEKVPIKGSDERFQSVAGIPGPKNCLFGTAKVFSRTLLERWQAPHHHRSIAYAQRVGFGAPTKSNFQNDRQVWKGHHGEPQTQHNSVIKMLKRNVNAQGLLLPGPQLPTSFSTLAPVAHCGIAHSVTQRASQMLRQNPKQHSNCLAVGHGNIDRSKIRGDSCVTSKHINHQRRRKVQYFSCGPSFGRIFRSFGARVALDTAFS